MKTQTFALALVTGASSGIGAGLCRLLAQKGIPLLITARNTEQLNVLAEELRKLYRPLVENSHFESARQSQIEASHSERGSPSRRGKGDEEDQLGKAAAIQNGNFQLEAGIVLVEVFTADISKENERQQLIEKIHERKPDLIINNAGFGLYGLAVEHETRAQSAIVEVNAVALLELTLEGAKTLIAAGRNGVIVNISSVADKIVLPGLAVYAASKAFVTQVSRSLDEEMASYGIRVLTSCPGVVDTDFRRRASGGKRTRSHGMDVSFAAEQIWKQIVKGKQLHYFDWKEHLRGFFARFIVPQKLLSKSFLHKITSIKNGKQ